MKITKKEVIEAIKFTLFSISAGVIQYGLFTILTVFTYFNYWVCYLSGLVASILWNFTLNRKFTFKASNNVPIAMIKVAIFYAIFTPVTTIGGNYLVEHLMWNEYLVTGLNMVLNLVTEFLYQRYFVFKNSLDTKN